MNKEIENIMSRIDKLMTEILGDIPNKDSLLELSRQLEGLEETDKVSIKSLYKSIKRDETLKKLLK